MSFGWRYFIKQLHKIWYDFGLRVKFHKGCAERARPRAFQLQKGPVWIGLIKNSCQFKCKWIYQVYTILYTKYVRLIRFWPGCWHYRWLRQRLHFFATKIFRLTGLNPFESSVLMRNFRHAGSLAVPMTYHKHFSLKVTFLKMDCGLLSVKKSLERLFLTRNAWMHDLERVLWKQKITKKWSLLVKD